jgi:predicted GNAT family acetyltransferase
MNADPVIRPLTPDLAADFVTLFGPSGACYGCWCQHFRLPPKLRQSLAADDKRQLMVDRILAGPPPGLIAHRGTEAVGWMQIGPRSDIPQWNNPRRATTPLPDGTAEDPGVWAISCFFFKASERGQGLSHAMVAAGIAHARRSGARLLEACPMDQAKQSKSIGLYVGSTGVFEAAGFVEAARQKPGRPLMRLVL